MVEVSEKQTAESQGKSRKSDCLHHCMLQPRVNLSSGGQANTFLLAKDVFIVPTFFGVDASVFGEL